MRRFRQVVFLGIVWLVVIGLLELGARLVAAAAIGAPMYSRLTMAIADPDRVWRYKPNYHQRYQTGEFDIQIRTNSWGLRDREAAPDAAAVRILAIGDSFTFGWGVEADGRFTEQLAALLQTSGIHVQILNAGHWMYTFDQHFLTVKALADRF